MKHNFNKIQKQIEIVKKDILNRFPNCSYTIEIILWDDGTYKVTCKYGNEDSTKVYISTFYKNKLSFEEVDIDGKVMVINEKGENTYKYLVDKI